MVGGVVPYVPQYLQIRQKQTTQVEVVSIPIVTLITFLTLFEKVTYFHLKTLSVTGATLHSMHQIIDFNRVL